MEVTNKKTGCLNWNTFKRIVKTARQAWLAGDQTFVDCQRREILLNGTQAQFRALPKWMK